MIRINLYKISVNKDVLKKYFCDKTSKTRSVVSSDYFPSGKICLCELSNGSSRGIYENNSKFIIMTSK